MGTRGHAWICLLLHLTLTLIAAGSVAAQLPLPDVDPEGNSPMAGCLVTLPVVGRRGKGLVWCRIMFIKNTRRTKGHFPHALSSVSSQAKRRRDNIWQQTWATSSTEGFMLQCWASRTSSACACHVVLACLHSFQSHIVSLVFIQSYFSWLVLSGSMKPMKSEAFRIDIVGSSAPFFDHE